MKVVWTPEAIKRLWEIEEFIARENPERAVEFITKLIEKVESVATFPEAGRMVPEFSLPNIREILEKNYRIVYRIASNRIEILTVFEGHRLLRDEEIFPP